MPVAKGGVGHKIPLSVQKSGGRWSKSRPAQKKKVEEEEEDEEEEPAGAPRDCTQLAVVEP